MTIAERVRKHRAKLRNEHCSRLDVWIAGWIVEGVRKLAKTKGREPWSEVQDVLEQHLIAQEAVDAVVQPSSRNQSAATNM